MNASVAFIQQGKGAYGVCQQQLPQGLPSEPAFGYNITYEVLASSSAQGYLIDLPGGYHPRQLGRRRVNGTRGPSTAGWILSRALCVEQRGYQSATLARGGLRWQAMGP